MISEEVLIERTVASVTKHFVDNKGPYPLYVEGAEINMASLSKWAELRITGPRILKENKVWFVYLDVNIMCSVKDSEGNIYLSQKMAGYFATKMNVIPVKHPLPTDTLIACLTLQRDSQHQLELVQWGRVNPVEEISVIATSVEAFYQMEISE
jgi:hypothetical protein